MSPRLGEWSLIRIISSHLATSSHTSDTCSRYTHTSLGRDHINISANWPTSAVAAAASSSSRCHGFYVQLLHSVCPHLHSTTCLCLYIIYATALLLTVLMCLALFNHLFSWIFSQPEHSHEMLLVKVPVLSSTVLVVTWVMSHVILVMPQLVKVAGWGQWGSRRVITATSTTITG